LAGLVVHRLANLPQQFRCRLLTGVVLFLDGTSFGGSAPSSAAPAAVPRRVSIFSRTDSKVGTPLAV